MKCELNINNLTGVRLTPYGMQYLKKYFDKLYENHPRARPPVGEFFYAPLWELMQIFGPEMYCGTTNQVFVDNKIEVFECL